MDLLNNNSSSQAKEISLLDHIRLIQSHDLNPFYSSRNYTVQFDLINQKNQSLYGQVTSSIALDLFEDDEIQDLGLKNGEEFLFSVFIESINILIGQQLKKDSNLIISPPRKTKISRVIRSENKTQIQKYELIIDEISFDVVVEYHIHLPN